MKLLSIVNTYSIRSQDRLEPAKDNAARGACRHELPCPIMTLNDTSSSLQSTLSDLSRGCRVDTKAAQHHLRAARLRLRTRRDATGQYRANGSQRRTDDRSEGKVEIVDGETTGLAAAGQRLDCPRCHRGLEHRVD